MNIGFVGLGVMGFPMAGHLQAAGHRVRVYHRTATRAQLWVREFGGEAVTSPREAATDADCVCLCVGNDDDVRSVVLSREGVLAGLASRRCGLSITPRLQPSWLVKYLLWQRSKGVVFWMRRSPVARRALKTGPLLSWSEAMTERSAGLSQYCEPMPGA